MSPASPSSSGRVAVGERDRARLVAAGRAGDHLALRLVVGEPERHDDRLLAVSSRRRSARRRRPGSRRSPRACARAPRRGRSSRRARPRRRLRRPSSLACSSASVSSRDHLLHPRVQLGGELEEAGLVRAGGAADAHEQDDRDEDEREQRRADRDEDGGSRQRRLIHRLPRPDVRPKPGIRGVTPSGLTVVRLGRAGYGLKTLIRGGPAGAPNGVESRDSAQPCAFPRLTVAQSVRYHRHLVGRGPAPASLCCVKAQTNGVDADRQSAGPERQGRPQGEDQDPCPPRRAAEAGRLHARVYARRRRSRTRLFARSPASG